MRLACFASAFALSLCTFAAACQDTGTSGEGSISTDSSIDARADATSDNGGDGTTVGPDGTAIGPDGTIIEPDGSESDARTADIDDDLVVPGARRATGATASAITSDGERLIAFYDQSNGELKLANKPVDGTWSETTVDTVQSVRDAAVRNIRLEIDAEGRRHLVYWDGLSALKYAYSDGDDWSIEAIDDTRSPGTTRLYLEVDADGEPHIVYPDSIDTVYLRRSEGTWTRPELPEALEHIDETYGFALSSGGEPLILYLEGTIDPSIDLASRESGSWETETVLEPSENRIDHQDVYDIHVDSEDTVDVVAAERNLSSSAAELVVATRTAGSWERRSFEIQRFPLRVQRLERTASGKARVLYRAVTSSIHPQGSLFLAHESESEWEIEEVTTDGQLPSGASMTEPGESGLGISYIDMRYKNLNWASRADDAWESTAIRHSKQRVEFVDGLTVDKQGRPRVVYQTGEPTRIGYATQHEDGWNRNPVEIERRATRDSISGPIVDSEGRTLFSVLDANPSNLFGIHRENDAWTKIHVDSRVHTRKSDISLGPQGAGHLFYRKGTGSTTEIRHARKTESNWQTETLDDLSYQGTNAGSFNVELDSDGAFHLIGRTENNGQFRLEYHENQDSMWTSESISGEWSVQATRHDLKLDSNGKPHVVFSGQKDAKYGVVHATRSEGDWRRTLVTENSITSNFQIHVGPNGLLQIVGARAGEVVLASNSEGEWWTRTVRFDDPVFHAGDWASATASDGTLYLALSDRRWENLLVKPLTD